MPERRIHYAGSIAALVGYQFAPCGARLTLQDDTEEAEVTCTHCRRWIKRYHDRRIAVDVEIGDRSR